MKKIALLFGLLFTTGILVPVYAQIPPRELDWVFMLPEPSEDAVKKVTKVQRKNDAFKRDSQDKRIIRLGDLEYRLSEAVSLKKGAETVYQNRYLLDIDTGFDGDINIFRHTDDTLPSDYQYYLHEKCWSGSCTVTNAPFGQERICSVVCDNSYVVSRFVPAADGYTYEFTVTDPTISTSLIPNAEDLHKRERELFSIIRNTEPEVITEGFIVGENEHWGTDSY